MSLEQLKYIVAVANYKSFSSAAEQLFISQSAISQSIIRLENELNIQLFDRKTTTILPTKEGQVLINQANKILVELEHFESIRTHFTAKKNEQYKIGVLKGIYLPFISKLISKKNSKAFELVYIEEDSLQLAKMIDNNELDVAILALYPETLPYLQHSEYINSVTIDLYIYMSAKSEYANYSSIQPNDFQDEKLVLYDGPFLNWFTTLLQKQYGPLNILFQSKNLELLRESIRTNQALSINTAGELIHNPQLKKKQMIAIPFEHRTIPKYHFGIAYSKRSSSPQFEHFLHNLNTELKKLFDQ